MDKILGSHDTMTYLTPKTWLQRIMNKFAKCQCLDYGKQIEAGAQVIDLRVYQKDGKWQFSHGEVQYKGGLDIYSVLDDCKEKYAGKLKFVRVIMEHCSNETDAAQFTMMCKVIEAKYGDVFMFLGGYRKSDWKLLYDFKQGNALPVYQFVSSMADDTSGLEQLVPETYAKNHNEENRAKTELGINLFDFIGKY